MQKQTNANKFQILFLNAKSFKKIEEPEKGRKVVSQKIEMVPGKPYFTGSMTSKF